MKAWQGQGSYGAVYRAERMGFRRSEPGALKASLALWNWRMGREVELLSRLNHPGIPRLVDRGGSRPPGSGESSYFVMEWVEGGYVLFQGKCLGPANAPPRKPEPTSGQPEER